MTATEPSFKFLLALIAVVVTASGCGQGILGVPEADREIAPDFSLTAVAGGDLGLSDLGGKVAILDFWATWCAPCHVQAEILEELQEEFEGQDLEIVSIDTGEKAEKVRAFVEKNPRSFTVLIDADSQVSDDFQVAALPTLIMLDRRGRIAFTSVGVTEANELRPMIREELENT